MGTDNKFIWPYLGYKKGQKNRNVSIFVGREKKVKRPFAACTFARLRGCRENRSGKSIQADRRSVSAWRGLEWKGFTTSAGAWGNMETYTYLVNIFL